MVAVAEEDMEGVAVEEEVAQALPLDIIPCPHLILRQWLPFYPKKYPKAPLAISMSCPQAQ